MNSYSMNVHIAGIIYLHRITDNRANRSLLRNLELFSHLCGQKAMPNVVIATTMWDHIKEERGAMREADLKKNYWADMLAEGCTTARFDNTYESAWNIVASIIQRNSSTSLLIQQELTAGVPLANTGAGTFLRAASPVVPKGLLRRIRKGFSL
jgi:hypothetical protein